MSEWFEIFQITAFHHLPLLPGIVKANFKPLHFSAKLVMKNSSCFLAAYKTTGKKLLFILLLLLCQTQPLRMEENVLFSLFRRQIRTSSFWDYQFKFAR